MTVIRTDKWMLDLYDKPVELCKKLKAQFFGVQATDIHNHLTLYGMYHHPVKDGNGLITKLQSNNVWGIVKKENQVLQKIWNGPDVPIFIFPSDPYNRRMKRDQNGKSGLAFNDKLFLFISEDNSNEEVRALLTHEYNHVCRLSKTNKQEKDYTLLDTIILEGLAENAVRERLGEDFIAPWVSYYTDKELDKLWNNMVYPYRDVSKKNHLHQDILHGQHYFPKMTGYCVGYHLVKKYLHENNATCNDILDADSAIIAQIQHDKTNE